MSGPSSRPLRLQSWIPPRFAWTTAPDVFCIDVPLGDPDIVEFMSAGVCEIDFLGTKKTARLMALLLDEKSLRRQLREAVWAPAKLKPSGSRIKAGTKVVAHCHGVFLLPDGKTLCVAVGRTKPTAPDAWIPAGLKADADALLLEHQSKVAEFDEAISRKKKDNEDFYVRNSDMKKFEGYAEAQVAMESHFQRPVLTAERLLPSLPRAAKFPQPTSGDLEGSHARQLPRSPHPAGCHPRWQLRWHLPGAAGRRSQGLVHGCLTQAYPRIRGPLGCSEAPACGAAQAAHRADGQPQVRHRVADSKDSVQVRALIRSRPTSGCAG